MNDVEFSLELFIKDLEQSVYFYKNILGLSIISDTEETIYLKKNSSFSLFLTKESILPQNHYFDQQSLHHRKGVGVELIIVVEDVKDLYYQVVQSNYPIESKLQKRPWGTTDFRVIDPDGYYLRITSKSLKFD